jgi:hypothetical protein
VLLGAVAILLINLNRRFLVGEEVDPRVRAAALRELLAMPEVARVTYLRLEVVGPRSVLIVGDVDLVGDDVESLLSVRLRTLEAKIRASPAVAGAVLSLSAPDEPSLSVWSAETLAAVVLIPALIALRPNILRNNHIHPRRWGQALDIRGYTRAARSWPL